MKQSAVPMPLHRRASMVPAEWAGHPIGRPFRRMSGKTSAQPWRDEPHARSSRTPSLMWRRVLLLVLVAFGAIIGTDYMVDIMPNHGGDWAEQGLLILYGVLFAWISAGFWTALMGLGVLICGRDRRAITDVLRDGGDRAPIDPEARTAVIMPICNEDVPTVIAGLRATWESLAKTDAAAHFDFFVLSDTNQPDTRAAEQAAWAQLVEDLQQADGAPPPRIYYRWRQHRRHRKAGNVADFCRRFGNAYRYMVVLDADSVMTGDCLAGLMRMMEARPDTGIIQTAPRACGNVTVHARVQQFGSRVYGPLFTTGMHFWQLGESNYWGHNAIIRMAPFIRNCALAPLPGSTSLSGDVMSHDFVEAALMRRAGYKVWIAYDLEGSFEQVPSNLLGELGRDRRWCLGNLQNSRLMFEPGLHPVHRSMFVTGVLSYGSSPLWLAFLVLSTVLFATASHTVPTYFVEPYQLFPTWPETNLKLILTLFGLTAVLLLAPKVLSLSVIVVRGQARRYGGLFRLCISAFLEFLHSVLLAPVRMLFHTQFVLAALAGIKLEWKSPPRGDESTGWGEAIRRHGVHTLLALAWIGAILETSLSFPWWLSPVLAGLLLAIPLSAWTSRAAPGRWLRRRGIFLIPEELEQPEVLSEAVRYAAVYAATPGVVDALAHHMTHARVALAVPTREPATALKAQARSRLVDEVISGGPSGLSAAQRMRLLGDAHALRAVREKLVLRVGHPDWWAHVAQAEGSEAGSNAPVDQPTPEHSAMTAQ